MSAKHTAGPWRVGCFRNDFGESSFPILDGEGLLVGMSRGAGGPKTESKANARLIAAAPDLLKALVNITECAEAGDGGTNMDLWIIQARAALKKARGDV